MTYHLHYMFKIPHLILFPHNLRKIYYTHNEVPMENRHSQEEAGPLKPPNGLSHNSTMVMTTIVMQLMNPTIKSLFFLVTQTAQ